MTAPNGTWKPLIITMGVTLLIAASPVVFGYGALDTSVAANAKEVKENSDRIDKNEDNISSIKERLSTLEEGQRSQIRILNRIERILENQ